MFLVGRNGAGKSNFLDSLRFVADALRVSLDHAMRDRGTIKEVRRKSGGHPNHFALRLDFRLPSGQAGFYSFKIGARPQAGFVVQEEKCSIAPIGLGEVDHFHVVEGNVRESSIRVPPAALKDRLFLVAASGLPQFRPVFDALSRIEVYNLNPQKVATLQPPDPGDLLRRDGSNAASVLQHITADAKSELMENLSRIVPGIAAVDPRNYGGMETLEFRQTTAGQAFPWGFPASSMSDGTLRAFAVLLAISQLGSATEFARGPLVIGLEEPEVALHPGAATTLLAALRRGARRGQILITSHSPDLLDNPDIAPESLLAVENHQGLTRIGRIDEAARELLRSQLVTAGELLRQGQIEADPTSISEVTDERQLRLFSDPVT
jgi:predicted ATPase